MSKQPSQEIKIELSPEVASGTYSNLAVINHGPAEFFLDFIALAPNMPQAKVQSRIIMTPENAKNLLFALSDNIRRYEAMFGAIKPITPMAPANGSPQGDPDGEIPNPFISGANA